MDPISESVTRDNVCAKATKLAGFGEYVNTVYRFDRADVILALDLWIFCGSGPGSVRYARDFVAKKRRVTGVDSENEPSLLSGINPNEYGRDGRSSFENTRLGH